MIFQKWGWISGQPLSTPDGRRELLEFLEHDLEDAWLEHAPDELLRFHPSARDLEEMKKAQWVLRGRRARVSRGNDGEALRFEIDRPTSVSARVRKHIAEQLGRAAQANPEAYVFRNLATRVPVTDDLAGEPLDRTVERLRQLCDALDGAAPEDVLHIHDECVAAVEDRPVLLGTAAGTAPLVGALAETDLVLEFEVES